MKNMLAVVAVALTAAGVAQASGNPIQRDPITVRVDRPVFLGPTPACQAFRAETRLLSGSGAVVGSSFFCVSSAVPEGPLVTQTGRLTLFLPGGKIVTEAAIVDDFGGFPIVGQTISGAVVEGSGLYLGASGTLSGGGTIVIDENGVPHPNSTLVVDLD
jgi:hypothetical protein